MATHSSTLAWKIPWMEKPGRLQSMGSQSRTRLSDVTFTFHFHALEKEIATHSSVIAWRIPGTAEPGGLPSVGSHRVGHDWGYLAAAAAGQGYGEGSGNPLQCSCLENPRDSRACWAAVYGVAQSQTQLKRISSSSSIHIQFIYVIQNLDSVLKSRDIILPTQVPIVEAMVFPVMYGCES